MVYIPVLVGLIIANFISQLFSKRNWGKACEITFHQATGVFIVWFLQSPYGQVFAEWLSKCW